MVEFGVDGRVGQDSRSGSSQNSAGTAIASSVVYTYGQNSLEVTIHSDEGDVVASESISGGTGPTIPDLPERSAVTLQPGIYTMTVTATPNASTRAVCSISWERGGTSCPAVEPLTKAFEFSAWLTMDSQ